MSTLKVDAITPNVEATTALGDTTPGLGTVLQVARAGPATGDISAAYNYWVSLDDNSVTMTPASTSSKFLIIAYSNAYISDGMSNAGFRIIRNTTGIGSVAGGNVDSTAPFDGYSTTYDNGSQSRHNVHHTILYIDSPNTTSPTSYSFQHRRENKGGGGCGTLHVWGATLIVQEIAG